MMAPETALRYRIVVQGTIDRGWSEWLDHMDVRHDQDASGVPVTVLTGPVADQSALRGLLAKIWDLNLNLVAVLREEPV
ncbi:MAG: hypothetical protein JW820_11470 [Spirochaetales bacterium]|nr:hypothetical protein [Spirochaetales bacterium]